MAAADTSIQVPLMAENHPPSLLSSDDLDDRDLDEDIAKLETFLRAFGFCQDTFLTTVLSWLAFALFTIVLPVWTIYYASCSNCEHYQIKAFELEIFTSQGVVAAISLLCISRNLSKYGIRELLFVDRWHGYIAQFRQQYIQRIQVLECFIIIGG